MIRLARDDGAVVLPADRQSETRHRTELALIVITLLMTAYDFLVVAREPLDFRGRIGAFDGALQLDLLSCASRHVTHGIADSLHTD